MGDHDRFDELAVGHVLGGLDASDAARFRSHLISCRACRSRVAELRSIADDLVAAEREELDLAAVRTEVARREHDDGEVTSEPPAQRLTIRHVTIAVVVVAVLGAAMAVWNLNLRAVAAGYLEAATARGETLEELATGVPVVPDLADGLEATVVVDGDDVAFTIVGIPTMEPDDVLVAWLLDADGSAEAVLVAPAGQVDGDATAGRTEDQGASELVISLERGAPGERPAGVELLRAELRRSADPAG